jgi:hypothetical protein
MWGKAFIATLVGLGLLFATMLFLHVGGMLPAWLLILYMPFVLVVFSAARWTVNFFKRRISN